ncbi:MAG: hypothetical protein VX240_01295 [Actinomycetota bacterium]|nr:hypothetical protein [Actinomycetota bacterium]
MNEQLVLTSDRNHRPARRRYRLDAHTRAIGLAGIARARTELRRRDPGDEGPVEGSAANPEADVDDGLERHRRVA